MQGMEDNTMQKEKKIIIASLILLYRSSNERQLLSDQREADKDE